MATCQEVIKSAYRRAGIRSRGVNLTALDIEVGLERLQAMYDRFVGSGLFGRFTDKFLDDASNYEAKEGERVYNSLSATVTFPTTVSDDGTTRAPYDGSVIAVVEPGQDPSIRIYDAMTASWQSTQGLTQNSVAPLSYRYFNAVCDLLAVDLCDEVGFPLSSKLVQQAGLGKIAIASRYDRPRKDAELSF